MNPDSSLQMIYCAQANLENLATTAPVVRGLVFFRVVQEQIKLAIALMEEGK